MNVKDKIKYLLNYTNICDEYIISNPISLSYFNLYKHNYHYKYTFLYDDAKVDIYLFKGKKEYICTFDLFQNISIILFIIILKMINMIFFNYKKFILIININKKSFSFYYF